MTNINKVSVALGEWGFNVAKSVLPKVGIPAESAIGKFMYGILGVNPATYNIWNELGFLAGHAEGHALKLQGVDALLHQLQHLVIVIGHQVGAEDGGECVAHLEE